MNVVNDKLDDILELIEFIHKEIPDGNALCQFTTVRVLRGLSAQNMVIAELKPGGEIVPTYQFGFNENETKTWRPRSIEEHIPMADSLRVNEFVWLSDKDNWHQDYSDLWLSDLTGLSTYICWPIHIRGSYLSVIGVGFNNTIMNNYETKNYLETISGLIGLQISSLKKLRLSVTQDAAVWDLLSNRQHKVVSMMSDGKTNNQIANELGYSQSTIRQETIKIYEILGVAGRKGATEAFRISFPIHSSVPSIG
jgi:DNA-binding CsgD family transcriptional regulator